MTIDRGILDNCRPVADRLLLLRLPDLPSCSSLVTPDVAIQPSHRGQVLRKGQGKRFDDGSIRPIGVNLTEVVRYQSCDLDDGKYVLIQEGDILGIESA